MVLWIKKDKECIVVEDLNMSITMDVVPKKTSPWDVLMNEWIDPYSYILVFIQLEGTTFEA